MPFSPVFESHPGIRRTLLVRRRPMVTFGVAVGLVIAATLLRWAISDGMVRAPFLTYYPAIVLATLIGGLWPGILAMALSVAAAWKLFLPLFEPDRHAVSLLLFVLLSGINVAVVGLLHAAVDYVLAQQENLRILIESSPTGIVVVDDAGEIKLVNSSTEKLFGYGRAELLGHKIEQLVPSDRGAHHRAICNAFFKKPEARPMGAGLDLSGRRKDGSEFPVEVALNPVRRNGRTGVLATVIDITDRTKAREARELVVRELQHRTQNLFAVFQGLASQSIDEGKTPAEAKSVLNGRLHALSEAYRALAASGWEGASLSDVVKRQVAGFSDRAAMTGCDILLGPSAAQQFALIVHELATNAVKHGSLSAPAGRVSIEGKKEGAADGAGVFSFVWSEIGGPPVSKPTRKGFGAVILLESVRHLARSVSMDFDPTGLTYRLQIDLSAIEMPKKPAATSAVATA
jgi:PAS domain S-box-containing protein